MQYYSVEAGTVHMGSLTQDYEEAIANLHRARLFRPELKWRLVFFTK